ncbi:MAG: sigma-54-dependent Fis family transcriptional regulator [Piscinibacter sp.]|uniref:sigma-54-dependent transcriptional regulator n=1 Tax=Piscinibacter sp. TaxID=1903157 RepID=UPI00258FF5EA|nr:sigma-54 dependent transcriptional regulator [Piscinibacter sp.]MCW5665027.1 sigma-54-dependent Fis family transcriptional regulator [Piscinibacter sp.]
MTTRIALIEDDPLMGESLSERLQLEGFDCTWWRTGAEVLNAVRQGEPLPDAVVSDIRLSDVEGPELLARLPEPWQSRPWIFITGYGTSAQREALLARGAADFFTKPLDMDRLIRRLRALQPEASAPSDPAAVLKACPLGVSGEIRRLHTMVSRLGANWDSVLVTGESGAGKEELARCLHRETTGVDAPFVAVNAASLPESLIEAELFGYEKGAFTGATRMHRGKFEQAHGGTLFLDEIGDMPLALQARLLRVLQDRAVTRLGGEQALPVQVRLIFATHKRLNEEVRAGRFREDLYYRINVVHLRVPPLRERPEDVPWLAQRFIVAWNAAHPAAPRTLGTDAEQALMRRAWPGNVRELRNAIERACLLSESDRIETSLLREDTGSDDAPPAAPDRASTESPMPRLEEFLRLQEREFIRQALQRHDFQIGVTADALGISRKSLWERMKRLAIG